MKRASQLEVGEILATVQALNGEVTAIRRRRPVLSIEQHRRLGPPIRGLYELSVSLSVLIGNAYPEKSKTVRLAHKLYETASGLKCELDTELYRTPEAGTNPDSEELRHIYYYPLAREDEEQA